MADRDVKVNLKLEASGNAPAALKDAAASAEKASVAAAKFSAEAKQLDGAKAAAVARGYNDAASGAAKASAEAKRFNDEQSRMKSGGVGRSAGVPGRGGSAGGMSAATASSAPNRPQAPSAQAAGPGGGGIAQSLGVDPSAFAAAGQAFAAVQVIAKAFSTAAKVVDAFSDETLSQSQKMKKIGESLPVVGEVFKSMSEFSDAISGKTEVVRKAAREDAMNTAKNAAELQVYQAQAPINTQIAANKVRAEALAAIAPMKFEPPSKDTLQGEIDYQRYERKAPLEMDRQRAEAEVKVASSAVQDTARERDRLEKRLRDAESKARTADSAYGVAAEKQKEGDSTLNNIKKYTAMVGISQLTVNAIASGFESTPALQAANDQKAALGEEQKLRQMLLTATQNQAESVKALAKAESDVRKANIALAKEELAVLKEREQAVKASATSYGSLSAVDKQAALEAAAAFQQKGYDALTPEAKAAIQAAGGGQVLQKAAEQSAQADPKFQQLQALLGLESDLKGIQKQQVELQAKVQVDVQVDEQKFSNALVDALNPVLKKLSDTLDKIAAGQIKGVQVGQAIQNAQQ